MKPFLKWPGNKYRIVKHIKKVLPAGKRLVEPFVGSGSVFLNTDYKSYLLCDINPDLINLYQTVKTYKYEFIDYCKSFFSKENNTKDKYYQLRDLFNKTDDKVLKSALFVYLNRHCYNGLVRYNSKGEFNTPFGRYDKPYFPEKEMRFFIEKCERSEVEFKCQDFRETFKQVKKGDVVYCDPPYIPLSDTANFTSYSKEGFNMEDQRILGSLARYYSNKGIPVIISNHYNEDLIEIYNTLIIPLKVRRNISCKDRKKVDELIAVFK
ncbi:Dam family site-specific DNA-(adenine-N6)-methyltransferase [Sulfurihydrogenibium azorense]|jgi:DNA adenine methylase|uniref:Site-specific DNA-methyltransferase (adenine-specific) n=1 Tax=Sulfurihydrogenibium azorense (strain DSM 15241 / OCM 825 / Az-Fu1) TaxID=204536 RepID=C1DV59_SULAA|nr:Dam family site-specific DNA-(adenine-N6)-methyltransferase [Sulfurihydrogenibium azorense]ACN99725.1 retron EC67 DNA adenine methylase [Sulfurihydrogenibium azorense Az-Fu1]MDM7273190.1 Dam family site-specific DNA-(adenine-N6)-methyltransferase [Sulfurihydrogenibium azorense]